MLATQSKGPGAIRSGIKLGIAAVIVIALLPFASALGGILGALPNPFATTHHERVQPPVLKSLQDLSSYHAASANLSTVVEQSDDADYIPAFIKGDDTTYLAVGSVDAVVDFSHLGTDAIVAAADGKSVTITLPAPTLATPQLDLDNSKVLSHSRGLVDRLGSVFADSPDHTTAMMQQGQAALATAAAETELVARAKANTTDMLTAMLRSLGYQQVTISFQDPPTPTP